MVEPGMTVYGLHLQSFHDLDYLVGCQSSQHNQILVMTSQKVGGFKVDSIPEAYY